MGRKNGDHVADQVVHRFSIVQIAAAIVGLAEQDAVEP
jgi:hypothetical protein